MTTRTDRPPTSAVITSAGRRRVADVEIVVPVYNEAADLDASIRRLTDYLTDRFPLRWLVTIADNASIDRTWAVACRLAVEVDGVQAVRLAEKGRGRALRAAWGASDAPVVAYMDVDLSTHLDALLPLVAPLLSGHSDVAIGSRLASGSRVVRGPRREFISRTYNFILHSTLHNSFSDAQCGFKALRREVAEALLPHVEDEGWFFDTELLVLAERNGMRIHEVAVDWIDDPDSRVDVLGTATDDLRGIARMLRRIIRGEVTVTLPGDPGLTVDPGLPGQVLRFASIGLASTAAFAVLFVALTPRVGALPADLVALSICAAANTAANRRLTFGPQLRRGVNRHFRAAVWLAVLPLGLNLATLGAIAALGGASTGVSLVALTGANALATTARFVLLRQWAMSA